MIKQQKLLTSQDRFIVEDLGDIRRETEKLRDRYNLPKMKILQYTLDLDYLEDKYNDVENMVIYTGNHDNNTIVGWYNSLSQKHKKNLRIFLENNNILEEQINIALIKYCLKSIAE